MISLTVFFSILISGICFAETEQTFYVAFIRDGDLWLKIDETEMQITKNKKASAPKWSWDGKFIAYSSGEQSNKIWVYSLESKKYFLIYSGGGSYQWAPNKNQLAFKIDGVLNIIDVTLHKIGQFKNVSLGTGNYSWLPDGSGFLVSSDSHLLPTGWTSIELFKVPADANMDRNKIKPFYTLPPESKYFFAIGTTAFKWSHDEKWIAFIATPTASWSMDSNILCVLSSDAKIFRPLDKMLHFEDWFQWAPSNSSLAYIEGEGRFAVENKHLKVKDFPAFKLPSYTPKGFVDRDFTWENDRMITVSRAKEIEWANDPAKRPLPVLYRVNIQNNDQQQITYPTEKNGDFSPYYHKKNKKLTWIRSDRLHADVWISNPDGMDSKKLITNIGTGLTYYDWWSWDSIIAWYEPDGKSNNE